MPPKESQCYGDLYAKVAQLWPYHTITYVKTDSGAEYFRVADFNGGYVWKVTGTCQNGYIEVRYSQLQIPGVGSVN